jgi:stage II sporulation protein M
MMIVENKPQKRDYFKVIQLVCDNRYFLICFLLLIIGMLFGALAVGKTDSEVKSILENEFTSFLRFRTESNFLRLFFGCFLNALIYATLILLSSFGVLGLLLIPLILIFKGFGTAAFFSLLYSEFSLTGVAFSNLVLIPPYLIASMALIFLSAECFELSLKFLLIIKSNLAKGSYLKPNVVQCFKKYVTCVLILTASALLEALLSRGFIRFFKF